jgi:hypothetical protein
LIAVRVSSEFELQLDGDEFKPINGDSGVAIYRAGKVIARFPFMEAVRYVSEVNGNV